MDEIFGLFPVPFMRAPATLDAALVGELVEYFTPRTTRDNNSSPRLTHTQMLQPGENPLLRAVAARISPRLVEFGTHLFGQKMDWGLKEMWMNVLEQGGHQAMHNHANSFVSGVVYLTRTHPGSHTVFMKSPGGTDFMFRNDHKGMTPGDYCADKWISPEPAPGDMVLFPSYLMHAVPPNQGARRISLAFNAIPARLDSWGYVIKFNV
ncbi:MAG: TIGR02466 family protein [Steroidobacteraceae bacterium]